MKMCENTESEETIMNKEKETHACKKCGKQITGNSNYCDDCWEEICESESEEEE